MHAAATLLTLVVALSVPTGVASAQDCGGPQEDCDGDGFAPDDGDCDDDDSEIRPLGSEVCEDRLDNDCNGFYDDGCRGDVRLGTLGGGGGCTGGTTGQAAAGTVAGLLLLPLLVGRRRR